MKYFGDNMMLIIEFLVYCFKRLVTSRWNLQFKCIGKDSFFTIQYCESYSNRDTILFIEFCWCILSTRRDVRVFNAGNLRFSNHRLMKVGKARVVNGLFTAVQ